MAVTQPQAQATGTGGNVAKDKDLPGAQAGETRLDTDLSMPSHVAEGDGPYDTTDPFEIATSVRGDKASAGQKGFGVVNAVVPLERIPGHMKPDEVAKFNGVAADAGERTESYEVPGPTGEPVKVQHNIDTGETKVS